MNPLGVPHQHYSHTGVAFVVRCLWIQCQKHCLFTAQIYPTNYHIHSNVKNTPTEHHIRSALLRQRRTQMRHFIRSGGGGASAKSSASSNWSLNVCIYKCTRLLWLLLAFTCEEKIAQKLKVSSVYAILMWISGDSREKSTDNFAPTVRDTETFKRCARDGTGLTGSRSLSLSCCLARI